MRMPDHQSIGLGVAGMRTITVGDSFGTQTELFRLLLAGPANDHIEKNKAVFLAYHPVFFACSYFVAMLANEFHVCEKSKHHTRKHQSVKLSQVTQNIHRFQTVSHQ